MILQQICFALVYLAEGLIAWQYFETFFSRKRKKFFRVITYSFFYAAAFFSFHTTKELLNIILFLLCNCCIVFISYHCSIGSAFFYAIIASGLVMGTEWLTALFLSQIYGTLDGYLKDYSQLVLFAVGSKLLYFLCIRIFLIISHGKSTSDTIPTGASFSLICFSLMSLIVIFTLFLLGTSVDQLSEKMRLWMIISAVGLLLTNIMIHFTYQHIQTIKNKYTSFLLQQQKYMASINYYSTLQNQYNRQRILIHDIRHHMETIKGLASEQNSNGVIEYIKTMEKLPELQKRIRFCSDSVLNAVFLRFDETCKEKSIKFSLDIRYCKLDTINPLDKTSLFGNLLENAVEAADGISDAFIELTLDYRQPQGIVVLSLRNSCQEAPDQNEDGSLRSKKGIGHGIGMESVNQIVKKYNGQMQWHWDESQHTFSVIIILPQL